MKKLGVFLSAVAMATVAVPSGVGAAKPPQCIGYPADWVGTDGNDALYRDQMVDKNRDGVFVAVGGNGNDQFQLSENTPVWDPIEGAWYSPTPKTLALKEYKACGWGGDDLFVGRWFAVDGGGGRDAASLNMCHPGDALYVSKIEGVSVYIPERDRPERKLDC